MNKQEYILVELICEQYAVEQSVVQEICYSGIVNLEQIENEDYMHENELPVFEKALRLHQELEINLAGIEVVFDLLQRIEQLEQELATTKHRLTIWQP